MINLFIYKESLFLKKYFYYHQILRKINIDQWEIIIIRMIIIFIDHYKKIIIIYNDNNNNNDIIYNIIFNLIILIYLCNKN